jgi:uncharacterized membrane protein
MSNTDMSALATKWLKSGHAELPTRERAILDAVLHRKPVARVPTEGVARTFGERLSDQVAAFGGSWTFIMLFSGFIVIWAVVNALLLGTRAFDPYPFIFLNLLLSMIAAVQAPIIMMSQNRQAIKDRLTAEHDYEVNLKAEIEIMGLHEKFDQLRTEQMTELLRYQQQQLDILTALLKRQPS